LLSISPLGLNLGREQPQALLSITNSAGGDLQVISVIDSVNTAPDWLSIKASDVDGAGLGDYTISINREDLTDGSYSGVITVESSEGSKDIPLIMQVGKVRGEGNAGYHYILLVDQNGNNRYNQQLEAVAIDGKYSFSFEVSYKKLDKVKFTLFAGSDFNNNSFICDNGEACGFYSSIDEITAIINPTKSINNLNFNTGFKVQLSEQSGTKIKPNAQGWKINKLAKPNAFH
jgi:serine protease